MQGPSILLIIEDEPSIRELLVAVLQSEDYQVSAAADGEQGWELLRTMRPELVLLDLRLPKITGREIIEKLEAEGNPVPVLVISAEKNTSNIKRSSGRIAFIHKPFELDELLESVQRFVQNSNVKGTES